MLNCREAARLLSDARETELPLLTRLSLGLHVLLCGMCARYKRQIAFLGEVYRLRAETQIGEMEAEDSNSLPAGARERIVQAIVKNQ